MKARIVLVFLGALALAGCARPPAGPAAHFGVAPRVLILDGDRLLAVRAAVEVSDPAVGAALGRLISDADQALEMGPYSVVTKTGMPPSGDRHDYMSIGVYWWPNPDTPDGLPYVRRDGEYTPEALDDTYDKNALVSLTRAIPSLALAYYLTGNEPYAEHAALLVRTWFVDPATRMNPHLRYGQAIPGRNDGRPIGIIETSRMSTIADAIPLIEASPAWTAADGRGVRAWYGEYLDWLLKSDFGRTEAAHYNNHGTWYDVQAAHFALFAGRPDVAREVLAAVPDRRFHAHLEPGGAQPHELGRTQSFNYSVMNIRGYMDLADLARHVGIDLWNYSDDKGRGLRGAVEYLLPYVDGSIPWPYEQITPRADEETFEILRRASIVWDEARYEHAAGRIPGFGPDSSLVNLLFPNHL
jgi:hypothetical protein